jgi:hypothetical protein
MSVLLELTGDCRVAGRSVLEKFDSEGDSTSPAANVSFRPKPQLKTIKIRTRHNFFTDKNCNISIPSVYPGEPGFKHRFSAIYPSVNLG